MDPWTKTVYDKFQVNQTNTWPCTGDLVFFSQYSATKWSIDVIFWVWPQNELLDDYMKFGEIISSRSRVIAILEKVAPPCPNVLLCCCERESPIEIPLTIFAHESL